MMSDIVLTDFDAEIVKRVQRGADAVDILAKRLGVVEEEIKPRITRMAKAGVLAVCGNGRILLADVERACPPASTNGDLCENCRRCERCRRGRQQ
jgi:hypothetical protein